MILDIYMRNMKPMIRHRMPDIVKIRVPFIIDFADIFSPWELFLAFYSVMWKDMILWMKSIRRIKQLKRGHE